MATTTILGLTIDPASHTPGTVGYYLHGPRATYRLVRQMTHPEIMFVLNSNGKVCGVRGNYTFSDRDGELKVVNAL